MSKPKRRNNKRGGKAWPDIIDGWMHDHSIRRDIMFFTGLTLTLILLTTITILGVIPITVSTWLVTTPLGWITGGITTVGGLTALHRHRRRLDQRHQTGKPKRN